MGDASAKITQLPRGRPRIGTTTKRRHEALTRSDLQSSPISDEMSNLPSPHSMLPKRGPGRPKSLSDSKKEKRRREQLRSAQNTYRARRQHEYTKAKKQNSNMQAIATALGTSLVELLNQLAAGNALQDNHALAQKVAASVRDMLSLLKVLQVDTLEDEADVNAVANTMVPVPTSPEIDIYQDREPELTYAAPLNTSELLKSQYQEITLSKRRESHLATPMCSKEIDAFDSSQPLLYPNDASNIQVPSSRYHQTRDSLINLYDWFSAKSLLLNRGLDPYNLYVYKGASLAERIEHSALVRAGWLLRDPTTTMNLVYKIFPFDKSPAPPHIQLFKINQLISRSHPNLNRQASSTSVPGKPPRKGARLTHARNFNNLRFVQWGEIYPLWLTAHDIERYLIERWDASIDADYVQITCSQHEQFRHDQRTHGNHVEYNNLVFDSMGTKGAASLGLTTLHLKIADLIEGFIQNGICLESIPAFERAEVDRVINKMVHASMLPDIIHEKKF
ncbi:hypothetical protein N431DRAFT_463097 [Stipitochalara longipes BDJ]|nr:hypothetical protein N431DRAFT_463097 [Stipitochalara longipes BDJ]